MGIMRMKEQDLVELYQLSRMYRDCYDGTEETAGREMMEKTARQYRRQSGKDITAVSSPRGAGRKKICPEETNREILELHRQGMSKRKIAEKIGCSLGHVQDVILWKEVEIGFRTCMRIDCHTPGPKHGPDRARRKGGANNNGAAMLFLTPEAITC